VHDHLGHVYEDPLDLLIILKSVEIHLNK
jgi:hypothetical protein